MSESNSTAPPASAKDTSSNKPAAAPAAPEQRYIPGAPPPAPAPTKSAIKKKRAKPATGKGGKGADDKPVELHGTLDAALTEAAPTDTDIKEGRVAEELVATDDEVVRKPSPLVEALNKRTKVLTKKIARASEYSSKPVNTLNEDQKRVIASLPVLEGVVKEQEDIKKLIETHEKEESIATAQKQEELESQHASAVKQAIAEAESNTISKIQFILSFLQLSSTITSQSVPHHLFISEVEGIAIIQATQALINAETEAKEEIIKGLSDDDAVGEVEGVPFSRFRELTNAFIHPPSAEPTLAVGSISALSEEAAGIAPTGPEASDLLAAADQPASGAAGNFAYIQNAELEAPEIPSSGLMFGAVNPDDEYESAAIANTQQEWVSVEVPQSPSANGAASEHAPVEENPIANQSVNIDWAADDEHDLPPLDALQAKFGPSGEATPNSAEPTTPAPEPSLQEAVAEAIGESSGEPTRPPYPNGAGHPNRGQRRGSGFRGGEKGERGGRGRGGSGFRGRARGDGSWRQSGGSTPTTPVTPGTPDEEGWISTAPKPRGGSGFRSRGRGGSGFRGGRGGFNQNQNQNQQQASPAF